MELGTRAGLTEPERWLIASDMQVILLDEIHIATRWRRQDGVFHGGTALHLALGSPRLSEDLDFMVAESQLDLLAREVDRIIDRARLRILVDYPGSILEFRAKDRGPGPDRLVTWDVRWRHPNRMGKVQVKLEFFATKPELLGAYRASMELRLPGLRRMELRSEIAVPQAVSFWADKVKAIASRPEFKWRDAFDLGFISRQFEQANKRPPDDELSAALLTCARIYDRDPGELAELLEKRLASGVFEDEPAFLANMELWFAAETHASLARNGTFSDMLARARQESEHGRDLYAAMTAMPGMAP